MARSPRKGGAGAKPVRKNPKGSNRGKARARVAPVAPVETDDGDPFGFFPKAAPEPVAPATGAGEAGGAEAAPGPAENALGNVIGDTLASLAAEAAADSAPAAIPPAMSEPLPAIPTNELAFGCGLLAGIVGDIICERAEVSVLTATERDRLGVALAGVVAHYLPAEGSPLIMAWATLALAVGTVAMPRVREARAREAHVGA